MKIEGWALVNCRLGSRYYDDSNWSLTHPRQLSSLSLRKDAELDNRWLCWQCNMPVEGAAANDTGEDILQVSCGAMLPLVANARRRVTLGVDL